MAATGKGKRVSLDGTNFMRQFRDEESRLVRPRLRGVHTSDEN
jgi:hypothetical protein